MSVKVQTATLHAPVNSNYHRLEAGRFVMSINSNCHTCKACILSRGLCSYPCDRFFNMLSMQGIK